MRLVAALVLGTLLLAGCSGSSSSSSGPDTSSSSTGTGTTTPSLVKATSTTGSGTTTGTGTAHGTTGTSTTAGNTTKSGNTTAPKGPYGVLFHAEWSGSLPDPNQGQNALQPHFEVTVPAGGDHLAFYYNATYTGAFSGLATITDPGGASSDTLTVCGIPPPGAQKAFSCLIDLTGKILPGTWQVDLSYEVGEATETYALSLTDYGYGAA